MKFLNILRFSRNFVEFTCEGGFTERFINLCTMNKILLWDISYNGKLFSAKAKAKEFIKLRNIARRSGVTLRLKRKAGLYFFCKKHSNRVGILIGVVFYFLFNFSMNQFVWTVDVAGNSALPKQDIIIKAEQLGLSPGVFKPLFDETTAANILAKESDDKITWAAINIKGSKAVIEIREKEQSIKENKISEPSNLVADFDGILLSVEVYSGIQFARPGNGVKKGDLLISGVFENDDQSSSFIESEGKITAAHNKKTKYSFSKNVPVSVNSSEKRSYALYFFGIEIPLNICSPSEETREYLHETYLSYNNVKLPLGVKVRTFIENEKALRSEKMTFLSSCEKYSNINYLSNGNTNILSKKVVMSNGDDSFIYSSELYCIDFIGKSQKIVLN